jgi:hypothetical protein
MKDIVDLKVAQVRLYPVDVLPISSLLLEKTLISFRDTLRFKAGSRPEEKQEVPGVELLGGEIEYKGRVHLIERLAIEQQRLILSVFGTSSVADAVYERIRDILVAADSSGAFPKSKPYVKVEETSCVATLDVDFRKLFAPPVLQFLEKTVRQRTSTGLAKSDVTSFKFSARISYELLDPDLKKADIRLSDKTLTIEPRIRTRLEERRYYTLSPTDSETHLALLREFEKAFKAPKK